MTNEREQYLLKALISLVMYIQSRDEDLPEEIRGKKAIFYSGTNPKTDYGRAKVMIAG